MVDDWLVQCYCLREAVPGRLMSLKAGVAVCLYYRDGIDQASTDLSISYELDQLESRS
jgi:hypothetical protein